MSNQHIPHQFRITWLYEVPFKGQSKALKFLVGGWTISGIHQYQTGAAFSVSQGGLNTPAGFGSIRPDIVGSNLSVGGASEDLDYFVGTPYLNTASFQESPRTGNGVPLRVGTAPRQIDALRGADDPQSRQRIWEMLAELQADGTALLLTTHQLDEAQQLCERIVIIDHGRTIASGTLRELLTATVGRHHEVTIRLDAPPSDGLAPGDWRVERTTMVGHVENVGVDLPAMLARIQAAGRSVEDVHLASPTLHSVFIALTGRELRE